MVDPDHFVDVNLLYTENKASADSSKTDQGVCCEDTGKTI